MLSPEIRSARRISTLAYAVLALIVVALVVARAQNSGTATEVVAAPVAQAPEMPSRPGDVFVPTTVVIHAEPEEMPAQF
jgi:hypothetical protein